MAPDERSPELWDTIAAAYDGLRPDQGLSDPHVRGAWSALIGGLLPKPNCAILDVGCGTGSLSLLLVADGHAVTGIDFAPGMVAKAREKAAASGVEVRFEVQDGSAPKFPDGSFDAIVCRQTLWALPDRKAALRNWAALLRTGGRMILIEGRFASGRGMSEPEILDAFPDMLTETEITDLGSNESLWGGPIGDQRVLVAATRQSNP